MTGLFDGCWFYILRCSDGSYYVGTTRTEDLETRVSQHNLGLFPKAYTMRRRPVVLVYSAQFANITEAVGFERQVKGWSRAKKEALIRGEYDALPALARRRQAFRRQDETPSSFETAALRPPRDEG